MYVFEFIYQGLNAEQIADFRYTDKRFLILFHTMEFIKNKNGQIERVIKLYKLPNNPNTYNKESLLNYVIKTELYKNYVIVIKLSNDEKKSLIKDKTASVFYENRQEIKNNKESIIKYYKNKETEIIKRELKNIFDEIRKNQKSIVEQNEKEIKKTLKSYENFNIALNELKPRDKQLFINKIVESKNFEKAENKKFFLKWTKTANKERIKRATIYILNVDTFSGLNTLIDDYLNIEKILNRKWERKLYYRDLYLSLFNKYLKESNGNKQLAKRKAVKEIQEKHIKPR